MLSFSRYHQSSYIIMSLSRTVSIVLEHSRDLLVLEVQRADKRSQSILNWEYSVTLQGLQEVELSRVSRVPRYFNEQMMPTDDDGR
jgi:hypothetical protein